jgi:hypothetical protein
MQLRNRVKYPPMQAGVGWQILEMCARPVQWGYPTEVPSGIKDDTKSLRPIWIDLGLQCGRKLNLNFMTFQYHESPEHRLQFLFSVIQSAQLY